MNDNKLTEIKHPIEKKDEIIALFSDYTIIEHTSAEKQYKFLDENALLLEIVNPYANNNLYIKFSYEFTLIFSAWQSNYSSYERDFMEMKNDAMAIINGKCSAMCFFVEKEWFGARLLSDDITYLTSPDDLIEKMNFSDNQIQRIKDNGADIFIEYWKPNNCHEFNVEKEGLTKSKYSFPRRYGKGYGVRYILKDNVCYGSGARRIYDDKTSLITYIYVEDIPGFYELTVTLIRKLEEDSKKAGSRKVITNIGKEDFEMYKSLGYSEIERMDNEEIIQFHGAIVLFDKTMMKYL